MQRLFLAIVSLLLLAACAGEKKCVRYAALYEEAPQKVYIAPLFDLTTRKSDADSAMKANYLCRDSVSHFFNSTLPIGLSQRGYFVIPSDSILLPGITSARRLKALQTADLSYHCVRHDADAVLIVSLLTWKEHRTEPTLFVEYQLRSTRSGRDLMHTWVKISRTVDTTYKGELIPLLDEVALSDRLHVDVECAMRCLMVQQANLFVMQDLPFTSKSYHFRKDLYLPATKQYFNATINNEGALEVTPSTMEEFENECFL
ncbi:MAG: hypothetical protein IJ620_02495 [Bacteroidales bacterium]|nr:hypothetical protein [Bacteroidales bacterium]